MIEASLFDWKPEPEPPPRPVVARAPLAVAIVDDLCKVALKLASIQIRDEKDDIGFSNSDVDLGRVLVSIVHAKPDDEQAVRALATLVGIKYRRQALDHVSSETVDAFRDLASEEKLSLATREAMRNVVVVEGVSGSTLRVSVQGNTKIKSLLDKFEVTTIEGNDGIAIQSVPLEHAANFVDALKKIDARIVGAERLPDLSLLPRKRVRGIKTNVISLHATQDAGWVLLTFDYHRDPETGESAFNNTIKRLPYADRSFAASDQGWIIRESQLGVLVKRLAEVGANVAQLTHYAHDRKIAIPGEGGFADRGSYIAVTIDGKVTRVNAVPYSEHFKNTMMSQERRRWNKDVRTWEIPTAALPALAEALRNLENYDVAELFKAAQRARSMDLAEPKKAVSIDPRASAMEKLMPHQRQAVQFLAVPIDQLKAQIPGARDLRGSILADDMGLGKTGSLTVTGDALTRGLEGSGKIVIVCPASVLFHWKRSIAYFIGEQEHVNVVTSADKGIAPFYRWNILSYGMLDSQYEKIKAMGIDIVIADEAHNIKTRDSDRSQYLVGGAWKRVKGKWIEPTIEGLAVLARERVLLGTGTPIPNKTKDIFNLLKAIGHPKGKAFTEFGQQHCQPKTFSTSRGVATTYDGAYNLEGLYRSIAPVFLQRKMDDVLDLPEKFRDYREVTPDLKIYNEVMDSYRKTNRRFSSVGETLVMLTQARKAVGYAKVPSTIEFAEEFVEAKKKIIIFSNYTDVLEKMAAHFGEKAVLFDGRLNPKQRDEMERKFQTDEHTTVFLGQWTAAGEGITLTAARTTIFNEIDWVPKTMLQAEARTRRIGQTGTTNNHYMIASGTVDDDIIAVVWDKIQKNNTFEGRSEELLREVAQRADKRLYGRSMSLV